MFIKFQVLLIEKEINKRKIEPPTTKVAGIWGPPSTLHIRTLTPRNTQSA